MDKVITMDDTTHKNLIAERDAAQDKVKSLTAELAAERERTEKTKQWGESYQRALGSYFTKMGLDGSLDERIAAVDKICDEAHALRLIAELMGLSNYGPDVVRRRVKDIRTERNVFQTRNEELEARLAEWQIASQTSATRADRLEAERDTAQARASELEKTLEAARSATQTYASAEIQSNERAVKAEARVKELEAELGKLSSAGIKVEPANDYTAEVHAARIDALKTLGVNPYDPPVCVIGAAKKKAKTLEHVQKFEDELTQIWELWGADRPQTPGCVYEAAQEMERTATALRVKLGTIAEMLNDARVPTHYGRDQKGGPVPIPERVDLLIASHDSARMLAETWESSSMREAAERMDAAALLDDLGSPSHAGSIHLTTSARIRALPGLLRQD